MEITDFVRDENIFRNLELKKIQNGIVTLTF